MTAYDCAIPTKQVVMNLRSFLFVPGDSERKLAKAESTAADALILDLEDSVEASQAHVARGLVRDYLLAHPAAARKQQIWVRVKPLQEPEILRDLAAVMGGAPDGIFLPKVRNAEDLKKAGCYLDALEAHAGLAIGSTRLAPILAEHPQSLIEISSFLNLDARVSGMSWGPIDLMAALGAATNRNAQGEFDTLYAYARGVCIVAARNANVLPIDTITGDYRDIDALQRDCAASKKSGFRAKMAIHPGQVDVINAAFAPDEDEIKLAMKVVMAFERAGTGVVGLDGVMLDKPHLVQAQELLTRAKSYRSFDSASADEFASNNFLNQIF